MSKKIKTLAIVGSIRKESYNKKLALEAKRRAPKELDIEIYIPDKLPIFTQDLEDNPPAEVKNLKRKIKEADALLFVTPEHNFTIPAALKNAIEWGNRPHKNNSFMNKPAGIMGVATASYGTVRAQNHLRQVFVDLSVITFLWPQLRIGKARKRFDEEGNLTDENMLERLDDFLEHFVKFVKRLPEDKDLFTQPFD